MVLPVLDFRVVWTWNQLESELHVLVEKLTLSLVSRDWGNRFTQV